VENGVLSLPSALGRRTCTVSARTNFLRTLLIPRARRPQPQSPQCVWTGGAPLSTGPGAHAGDVAPPARSERALRASRPGRSQTTRPRKLVAGDARPRLGCRRHSFSGPLGGPPPRGSRLARPHVPWGSAPAGRFRSPAKSDPPTRCRHVDRSPSVRFS
jgi:hypothetical protein